MLCKNWKLPFEECMWASSSNCEHIYSYQLHESIFKTKVSSGKNFKLLTF